MEQKSSTKFVEHILRFRKGEVLHPYLSGGDVLVVVLRVGEVDVRDAHLVAALLAAERVRVGQVVAAGWLALLRLAALRLPLLRLGRRGGRGFS